MTVERQLGSGRKPNASPTLCRAAVYSETGNSYRFFNSEYEFVELLATRYKQSIGHFLIANLLSPEYRRPLACQFFCSNRAALPETLNRVESLVSHRKYTTEYGSTRDARCQRFASFSRLCAALLHLIFTNSRFGRRTGIPARVLPAMPGHQSPVTTHSL